MSNRQVLFAPWLPPEYIFRAPATRTTKTCLLLPLSLFVSRFVDSQFLPWSPTDPFKESFIHISFSPPDSSPVLKCQQNLCQVCAYFCNASLSCMLLSILWLLCEEHIHACLTIDKNHVQTYREASITTTSSKVLFFVMSPGSSFSFPLTSCWAASFSAEQTPSVIAVRESNDIKEWKRRIPDITKHPGSLERVGSIISWNNNKHFCRENQFVRLERVTWKRIKLSLTLHRLLFVAKSSLRQ